MAPYDVDVGHFTLYQPCTRLQAIINASMVLVERNQSSTQPVTPYLKKIQQAWVGHFNPFQVHVKFNLHDLVVEGDAISKTLMRRLRESLVRAEFWSMLGLSASTHLPDRSDDAAPGRRRSDEGCITISLSRTGLQLPEVSRRQKPAHRLTVPDLRCVGPPPGVVHCDLSKIIISADVLGSKDQLPIGNKRRRSDHSGDESGEACQQTDRYQRLENDSDFWDANDSDNDGQPTSGIRHPPPSDQKTLFPALLTFLSNALQHLILGKSPANNKTGTTSILDDHLGPCLADLVPSVFRPGYLAAVAARSCLLPTLTRIFSPALGAKAHSRSLRHKLDLLHSQSTAWTVPPDEAYEQDINSVKISLWNILQKEILKSTAVKKLKSISLLHGSEPDRGINGGGLTLLHEDSGFVEDCIDEQGDFEMWRVDQESAAESGDGWFGGDDIPSRRDHSPDVSAPCSPTLASSEIYMPDQGALPQTVEEDWQIPSAARFLADPIHSGDFAAPDRNFQSHHQELQMLDAPPSSPRFNFLKHSDLSSRNPLSRQQISQVLDALPSSPPNSCPKDENLASPLPFGTLNGPLVSDAAPSSPLLTLSVRDTHDYNESMPAPEGTNIVDEPPSSALFNPEEPTLLSSSSALELELQQNQRNIRTVPSSPLLSPSGGATASLSPTTSANRRERTPSDLLCSSPLFRSRRPHTTAAPSSCSLPFTDTPSDISLGDCGTDAWSDADADADAGLMCDDLTAGSEPLDYTVDSGEDAQHDNDVHSHGHFSGKDMEWEEPRDDPSSGNLFDSDSGDRAACGTAAMD